LHLERDAVETRTEGALIDVTIVEVEMRVEEITIEVAIEIGVDKIEAEITEMETVEVTGPALNVKIQTLPSEINVIAVKPRNLAGAEEITQIIKEAEEMTQITKEVEVTGIEENEAMVIVEETGLVLNARIQTLLSETNVIVVKPRNLVEAGTAIEGGRKEETAPLENNHEKVTEEALEAENAEDLEMEILDKAETQEVGVQVVQINLEEVVSVGQQVAEIAETDLVAVVEEDNFNFYIE
tara:strand:- start:1935 stop:2654 length:720 start_codon:yes stop_codon:yes gene_type:complete